MDDQTRFLENLPKVDGYVDFTKLKKVGNGGSHEVFQSPEDPRFVIKIGHGVLKRSAELGRTFDPESKKLADRYIEDKNSKNKALYAAFGDQACLKEDPKIIKARIKLDGKTVETETFVILQESTDLFSRKDILDFSNGYREVDRKFAEFQKRLKADKALQPVMRDFLYRFKAYFETTGNFIDLAGEKNVVFYPVGKQWSYKLGSVLKGDDMIRFKEKLAQFIANPKLANEDEDMVSAIKNGFANEKIINTTAKNLGMGEIIKLGVDPAARNLVKKHLSVY